MLEILCSIALRMLIDKRLCREANRISSFKYSSIHFTGRVTKLAAPGGMENRARLNRMRQPFTIETVHPIEWQVGGGCHCLPE